MSSPPTSPTSGPPQVESPPTAEPTGTDSAHREPLTTAAVLRLWWPLAASWLLMGVELPLFSAVVARLPDSEVHLAAFGSVVFPVSLLVEAPIIMLLAASTALCTDREAYAKLHRFMMAAGFALTVVHALLAFTPLFDAVALGLLNVPPETLESARLGLQIMTPWTWAIAHRRFHQGVLIRAGHSRAVGVGTLVRLAANGGTMLVLALYGGVPGIAIGSAGIAIGVLAEAWIIQRLAAPSVAALPPRSEGGEALDRRSFLAFYVPLALTPLLTLLIQPLGAAAMGRMPGSLLSLAAWPPVHGLVFLTRSLGFAFNEVVVAQLGRPGSERVLLRFAWALAGGTVALLVVFSATPLASLWFDDVQGLEPELAELCRAAVWVAVLMPGYQAMQSWYQGVLVHHRRTRGITEAVVLYLVLACTLLIVGVWQQPAAGILTTLACFVVAGVVQTAFLAQRARRCSNPSLASPAPAPMP